MKKRRRRGARATAREVLLHRTPLDLAGEIAAQIQAAGLMRLGMRSRSARDVLVLQVGPGSRVTLRRILPVR